LYEVKDKFYCCHGFAVCSLRDFSLFQTFGKTSSSRC
jgi:hypothetical protein